MYRGRPDVCSHYGLITVQRYNNVMEFDPERRGYETRIIPYDEED